MNAHLSIVVIGALLGVLLSVIAILVVLWMDWQQAVDCKAHREPPATGTDEQIARNEA
ncbi:hypothetical protein KNO81_41170 [Paraburkholderia sediminicola]|jgi:hypothetical protein|nr:hypothetical protein [Paraburkholderia sediminicola]